MEIGNNHTNGDIESLLVCLVNVGIPIDKNIDLYSPLIDLIENSIQFISMIIEIEKQYGIEIPDVYLNINEIDSINDLNNIIINILEEENI
jgi:acyl carrier protein